MLDTYVPVALPEGCTLLADEQMEQAGALPMLRELVAQQGLDADIFELRKHETGKPYGVIGSRTVGVSISHCQSMLVCGLHAAGEIGIDVEPEKRKVHPRLLERICHPAEQSALPDDLCCIRMWTIKEAVLKYKGTGLRLAMNSIRLEMTGEHAFHAFTDTERITIASFPFRRHWSAVATK
jgi:4'-phosphopantetheinyl transferase